MAASKKSKTFEIKFTTDKLETIKPPIKEETHIYRDTSEKGFTLRIYRSNKKVFYFQSYKTKSKHLGNFPYITLAEAKAKVFEIKRNICNGVDIESIKSNIKIVTFEDVYNRYWNEYVLFNCTERSRIHIQERINYYAKHLFTRPIKSITSVEIQKLHTIASKNGIYAANGLIGVLSPIFNYAINWEYIDKNPCSKVKKHREISRSRFLSSEEIKNLFDSTSDDKNQDAKDFIVISLYTGVRKSSVLSMKWKDVSFLAKTWSVLIKNKERVPQILPLVEPVMQILERRKNNSSKWVFSSDLSKTGHLEGIRKPWVRILNRAGLEDVRIHDLRRTLASWMEKDGKKQFVISQTLNHKDSKATDLYINLNTEVVRDAITDIIGQFKNIRNGGSENQPPPSKEEKIKQLEEQLKQLREES